MDGCGGEQGDELEYHQGWESREYRMLLSVFTGDLLAFEEMGGASESSMVDSVGRSYLPTVYFLHAGDIYRNDGVDAFAVVLGGF